jgi:hypothetical protein
MDVPSIVATPDNMRKKFIIWGIFIYIIQTDTASFKLVFPALMGARSIRV